MKDWKFNDRKKKGTSFVCYNVELKASIMDSQTFETFDVSVDEDIKDLVDGDTVEYWNVEGIKIIKRKL